MLRTLTLICAATFLVSGVSLVWQIGTERFIGSVTAVILIAMSVFLSFTAITKMAGRQKVKKE